MTHQDHIEVGRGKEHIRFCFQLFETFVARFSEAKNVFYDVKSKLDLAPNAGFLVLHIPKPAGAFTFNPGILAIGLLPALAGFDICEIRLSLLDLAPGSILPDHGGAVIL